MTKLIRYRVHQLVTAVETAMLAIVLLCLRIATADIFLLITFKLVYMSIEFMFAYVLFIYNASETSNCNDIRLD